MKKHIHILGASGSGTTTLAEGLCKRLGYFHMDTDNYYWYPTDPPFIDKRPIEERIHLIKRDMEKADKWIMSGSNCGWGDVFIDLYDLVIFLYVPAEIRMERLRLRELQRYGCGRLSPGGDLFRHHKDFMEWAAGYESGGMDERSLLMHNEWLKKMKCPVIRIEGVQSPEERLRIALEAVTNDQLDK